VQTTTSPRSIPKGLIPIIEAGPRSWSAKSRPSTRASQASCWKSAAR